MIVEGITVVGGQINYPNLNSKIEEIEYSKAKAHMWLYMLNEGKKPKKWLKATGKGTKVNFEMINSQEEYEKGLEELTTYCNEINQLFGLDYKITKSE